MPNDASYGSPQSGGGSILQNRTFWFILVGGVGAYLLYRHYQGTGSILGSGTTGTTTAPASPYTVDPSTGIPINPSTGLDFGAPGTGATASGATQNSWLTSAEQSLTSAGYDPGLVNRALFDYINGNSLDNQEQGAISAALGKVGFPPNLPPFTPTPAPPGNTTTTDQLSQQIKDLTKSETTQTNVIQQLQNQVKKLSAPKPSPTKTKVPTVKLPKPKPRPVQLNAGTLRGGSPS